MPELQSWLQSSHDPAEVSNTVRGVILASSSIIVAIAAAVFHVTLTPETISAMATDIGMLAGVIWIIYGLLMKGVVKLGTVRRNVY